MDINNSGLDQAVREIKKVIVGKDEIIEKVLIAILAKGHVLIEDIPGVGKTTLALALSRVLQLDYRRMQFTPDVLPSDVIGFQMYTGDGTSQYRPGCSATFSLQMRSTAPHPKRSRRCWR